MLEELKMLKTKAKNVAELKITISDKLPDKIPKSVQDFRKRLAQV